MNTKVYETGVITDSDYDEIPTKAQFEINDATANKIIMLSKLVHEHDLYKVEMFNYRSPIWLDDNSNQARVDSETLNVSKTDFWFSAYIKHTAVEISTAYQRISDLNVAELKTLDTQPLDAKIKDFIAQIAGLSIWGYDQDNGERYAECKDPDDGHTDSHNALMNLIEEARKIVASYTG